MGAAIIWIHTGAASAARLEGRVTLAAGPGATQQATVNPHEERGPEFALTLQGVTFDFLRSGAGW